MRTSTLRNDPSRAGQLASSRERFGEFGRYAVAPVHTRFDALQWFVWDAERPDEDGRATIIRQEETREAAIAALI